MEALSPGAHLASPRWGYVHHGIYAGDGRVIHYAGFNRLFRRGPVEEVPLASFSRGHGYSVQSGIAPKYAAEAIVERARTRLGESRYRIWSNNCEHFVSWCLADASQSPQVEAWKARIDAALDLVDSLFRGRGSIGGEQRGAALIA